MEGPAETFRSSRPLRIYEMSISMGSHGEGSIAATVTPQACLCYYWLWLDRAECSPAGSPLSRVETGPLLRLCHLSCL